MNVLPSVLPTFMYNGAVLDPATAGLNADSTCEQAIQILLDAGILNASLITRGKKVRSMNQNSHLLLVLHGGASATLC